MNTLRMSIVAGMTLLAAAPVHAQFIDFEDVPTLSAVPDGYRGFDWFNLFTIHQGFFENSGFNNMDGLIGVANGFGEPAAVSRAAAFTFRSALIGAAWNNGLTVTVRGLLNGVELFSQALVVNTSAATVFEFGWAGINELQFSSAGGVEADLDGSGEHFIMDNLDFGATQVVPEPISVVLVGTGLAAIGVVRRRRRVVA